MTSSSFLKALLAPAVIAAAFAAPLFSAAPASAASCQPDPYNGVCVSTTNYTVKTTTSKLAIQRTPKTGNTLRSVANGTIVAVICQINNGGTVTGSTSRTWNAVSGGGWIHTANLNTPALGSDGYSPGMRHCGAAASSGSVFSASNYPWPTQDAFVSDSHGYYQAECVSFAAWAVRTDGRAHTKSPDFLGNANLWTGAYVDTKPQAGDVAQWDGGYGGAGSVGHVAYVTSVNADGTVTINEYNWGNFHRLNVRTIPANTPSRYLHF
jgi:surface antigen